MDESSEELQVQLLSYFMLLMNFHKALVSLHGMLEACIAYLIIRKNKRKRIGENEINKDDRQIRREISMRTIIYYSDLGCVEATINLDEDVYFGNQETFVSDDPALQTSTNNTVDQSNSSVKSKTNPRKRKVNHEDVLVSSLIDSVNNIGGKCEMTSRGVQDVTSYFKKLIETNECQDKVYDAIIAVENLGLNDSQILEVAEIIASSQSTSRFFFQLPMDAKKRFLWKKLGLLT